MSCILFAYSAFLVNLIIFKNVPFIRIGQQRYNFGGGGQTGQGNFIPFKTILPYLQGEKGWLIGVLNLVGNVALFVPIGILIPLVVKKISWQKTAALAIAIGFVIESIQVLFRLGIFDIDDIILNGLGVMVGYLVVRYFRRDK